MQSLAHTASRNTSCTTISIVIWGRGSNNMALFTRRSFCVVTGGSRGLGREIALRLSRGWSAADVTADVVVLSRDRDAMLETKRMIEETAPGVAVHVIQADLGEINSLDETNAKVWSLHDASRHEQAVLVLNAGTIGNLSQPISQQTCPEAIQNYMAINFTSNWSLSANFLSRIKSGPRLIINITSLLGRVPMAGFAAYGSAKAACSHFMQILAAENPEVRVLNYSPGPLDTNMFHKIISEVHSETVRKAFQDTCNQGKLLSCETSVKKLIGILEEDNFENAATVDYYDE